MAETEATNPGPAGIDRKQTKAKVFNFTRTETVRHTYQVPATSWAEAKEILEEGDEYDFRDYDSHEHVRDGAFRRDEITYRYTCAIAGDKASWRCPEDRYTQHCFNEDVEDWKMSTLYPHFCLKCASRFQSGYTYQPHNPETVVSMKIIITIEIDETVAESLGITPAAPTATGTGES